MKLICRSLKSLRNEYDQKLARRENEEDAHKSLNSQAIDNRAEMEVVVKGCIEVGD